MVIVGPKFVRREDFHFQQIQDATGNFSSDNKFVRREDFHFQQIQDATGNFSSDNKIGQGRFGPVYKGVLPNKVAIAVQRLSSKTKQGNEEFMNEVGTISGLKHPNLIRLLGYCTDQNGLPLLVFEYMENNSLSSALFGPRKFKSRLNWPTRFKICLGIAKGLAYLHEKIIHSDINPTNILLDKDLNAKISDFGLAKHNEGEHIHIITDVARTSGYMAPEYAIQGHLTYKADVYSFGVVMLEIFSGKKCTDYRPNHEMVFLLDLAYVLQQKSELLDLIDPEMMNYYSVKEARGVLDLAMLCANPSPILRPTMSHVVRILEGKDVVKSVPIPASYSVYDFKKANALAADLCLSTHSTCDSTCETSNAFSSYDASREANVLDMLVQNRIHDISDENANMLNYKEEEEEEEEEEEDHVVFDGDNSISKIREDQCIGETNERGGNKDDVKLIEENVSMVLGSPKSSNDERSWTSALFMDHTTHKYMDKGDFAYVEPLFDEDGTLYIDCSEEDFETGCNEWKHSLVGCFVADDRQPAALENIMDKEKVEKLWGLKGEMVSVIPMENGYFVFHFKNLKDKIRVLESGPWYFGHRPLLLREWDWKFKFDKADEIRSLPIWVKIYDLPFFLWSSSLLCKVGSGLGIPLYADEETKEKMRLDFARLCVEVDARKPLPDSLNISVRGIEYQIKFKYDWKPLQCSTCCTFGHQESKCVLRQKTETIN